MDISFVLFAGSLPMLRRAFPARIGAMLRLWYRRAYERRLLARLGERERRDLALTAADVARESAKPFWRG